MTFLTAGEKDEGEYDHLESLSRPVSGERSSHDDNDSVGSVRPGSAASSNITGKLKSSRRHSMKNVRDGKVGGTSLKCLWGGRGGGCATWNDQIELTFRLCTANCIF